MALILALTCVCVFCEASLSWGAFIVFFLSLGSTQELASIGIAATRAITIIIGVITTLSDEFAGC